MAGWLAGSSRRGPAPPCHQQACFARCLRRRRMLSRPSRTCARPAAACTPPPAPSAAARSTHATRTHPHPLLPAPPRTPLGQVLGPLHVERHDGRVLLLNELKHHLQQQRQSGPERASAAGMGAGTVGEGWAWRKPGREGPAACQGRPAALHALRLPLLGAVQQSSASCHAAEGKPWPGRSHPTAPPRPSPPQGKAASAAADSRQHASGRERCRRRP